MDDDKKVVNPENGSNASEAELMVQENSIKIVSPGAMVLKRFFRSKLSVVGLVTLILLFIFSFLGPVFSVWGETGTDEMLGEIQVIDIEREYSESINGEEALTQIIRDFYSYTDSDVYDKNKIQNELDKMYRDLGGSLDARNAPVVGGYTQDFATFRHFDQDINYIILYESSIGHVVYTVDVKTDDEGNSTFSRRTLRLTLRNESSQQRNLNAPPFSTGFVYKQDKDGNYVMREVVDENGNTVLERVQESGFHLLGTDEFGRDVLTRLMYGGRVSLTLGFVVVFIQMILGMLFGGLAGYFGKWVDNLIMRVTDILICLPGMPILLIVSTILDGMENIPDAAKIYYVMAVLSLIGWPGTARFIRGQILMLREQEYMVAAEALGLGVPRRIVKHLLPNVMPLLIVSATAGLGGIILTEASLSYLGLGIKAPSAAWGTMINGANNPEILEYFPNQWIPAGVMIMLAVLAFNFLGDGLRDAFDPKMKR